MPNSNRQSIIHRLAAHLLKHHFPFLWSQHLARRFLRQPTDFRNPRNLNDKIRWLMFYTDCSHWTPLADKYAVRQYVADRVGTDCLVPLLGKWDNAADIDFDSLPEKFVIKPNNGSYDTVICRDKSRLDTDDVRRRMHASMKQRFGYEYAELHYVDIRPCIIAEQLLESDEPGGLIDYKIWCFNGKPHSIFVCANRDNEHHRVDFVSYDLNWNKLEDYISDNFRNDFECPRPDALDQMLRIAARLSDGLPQARIDLYYVGGKIYFGEITLSSNFGMMPYFSDKALLEMGRLVTLPTRSPAEVLRTWVRRNLPLP